MELRLTAKIQTPASTISELSINGIFECYVIEDAVHELAGVDVASWKIPGKTAIPAGRYRVTIDWSNRFQRFMPHILDVPGFSGIRIHTGNDEHDTEGCLLVGKYPQHEWVAGSGDAWRAFLPKLKGALDAGEEIWIEISRLPGTLEEAA